MNPRVGNSPPWPAAETAVTFVDTSMVGLDGPESPLESTQGRTVRLITVLGLSRGSLWGCRGSPMEVTEGRELLFSLSASHLWDHHGSLSITC